MTPFRTLACRCAQIMTLLVSAVAATSVVIAPAQAATPGTPVPQLPQVNQSSNGGDNTSLGFVRDTAQLGRPDAGVVPVVGRAGVRADDGATVAYESRVDARTVDLMVSSPALAGAAPVRLLLPASWSSQPARTFPTLVLLPGASEKADYQSWSLYSHAVPLTAGSDALVVMPSVGSTGLGADWTRASRGYQYGTFLAVELPQLLERGYRASGRSAVAGVSTGGYTAVALAASDPGGYVATASFSGLVNSSAPVIRELITAILLREGLDPFSLWGDPYLGYFTWRANDPATSVSRLAGTDTYVSSGNGTPGPLDPAGTQFAPYEASTYASSQGFVAAASRAGVPLTTDFYGAGTHTWPYWDRQFASWWPRAKALLGA